MQAITPVSIETDKTKFTLLLKVSAGDAAQRVAAAQGAAAERGLTAKEEFHITVIGFKTGKALSELYAHRSAEEQARIIQALHSLAKEISWEAAPIEGGLLYIEKEYAFRNNKKEKRSSIIQLLDMPGMQAFYTRLNAAIGTDFALPPPHMTLFTGNGTGIGIDSMADLEQLKPQQI